MSKSAPIRLWIHTPLDREIRAVLSRIARLDDVAVVTVMPDVHLAKAVCVGAVVATRSKLYPDAVGGDIGCGMTALRFNGAADVLDTPSTAASVLRMLAQRIPVSRHQTASAKYPAQLAIRELSTSSLEHKKNTIGRVQFATLGRGNHFVEFQRDEEGMLWLMVHSGSRGIGQGIREQHGGGDGKLNSIIADSEPGRAYLHDLQWALDYAQQSRRKMVEVIVDGICEQTGITADWEFFFDCHHNFVRQEKHDGQQLWVHRKGAISARDGELGIIPGSMGSLSFHVIGRGNTASLCSSSHGAGRVMSRTEARSRFSTAHLLQQMDGVWFDRRNANRLRDEAPRAYKNIGAVMRAQKELVRIHRRLTPILVFKGG